jgi:hypothetical protein
MLPYLTLTRTEDERGNVNLKWSGFDDISVMDAEAASVLEEV